MIPDPCDRTLRFWTWAIDGFVKLSLRPGDVLTWGTGGPNEEGWSSRTNQWRHDGTRVVHTLNTDQRDCDGRLSTHNVEAAQRYDLAIHRRIGDDGVAVRLPAWENLDSSQRDYAAEAAGY